MSPGAAAKAVSLPTRVRWLMSAEHDQDNARLLAPALHMSHLNSPTDIKFRELPLSPMRKMEAGSATHSPLASPKYTTHHDRLAAPGARVEVEDDQNKRRPEPIRLSLRRVTTSVGDGIITDRKPEFVPQEGRISVHVHTHRGTVPGEERLVSGTAVPKTSRRVDRDRRDQIKAVHELQVHVETVD